MLELKRRARRSGTSILLHCQLKGALAVSGGANDAVMDFPAPIVTTGNGVRPLIRNTTEALRFIDRELPAELKALPRWTFSRELLVAAERSNKNRDLTHAYRQLRQALSNDLLLNLDKAHAK